jgi:hypothetical protein
MLTLMRGAIPPLLRIVPSIGGILMRRYKTALRVPNLNFNYCAIFQWKINNIYPIACVLNPHSEWSNILMTDYNKLYNNNIQLYIYQLTRISFCQLT